MFPSKLFLFHCHLCNERSRILCIISLNVWIYFSLDPLFMPWDHSLGKGVTGLYCKCFIKVYYTTEYHIMKNNIQKSCAAENGHIFYGSNKVILKPIKLSNEAEARQGPVTWNMVLPVDFQICTGSFHIERISMQTDLERPPMIMSAFTQEILLLVAAVQPCHVWHIQNRGQATPKTRLTYAVSIVYSSLGLPSSTSRGKVSEVPAAMWCSSVQ